MIAIKYVVSDVHGYYKKLYRKLQEKGFFNSNDNQLILCGDAFDRGSQAKEMQTFLHELLMENRLIYIRGNHEDLMQEMIDEIKDGGVFEIASGMSHHYQNGTWNTALQIAGISDVVAINNPNVLIAELEESVLFKQLLPACVDYYETDKYIFTHGFIPVIEYGYGAYGKFFYNPDWRNASKEEWSNARWLNGMQMVCQKKIYEAGKTIVVGHFHTSWGHYKLRRKGKEWGKEAIFAPFYDKEKRLIALDACTAESGKVNCIVLE